MSEKKRVIVRTYYVIRTKLPWCEGVRYLCADATAYNMPYKPKEESPRWTFNLKETAITSLRMLRKYRNTDFDHAARVVTVRVYGWR